MTELTDFSDTSDVSDAAIEWVADNLGLDRKVYAIRDYAGDGDWEDCAIIIAARLIQQHRPELLVDPVDVIVREEIAKAYEANGLSMAASQCRNGVHDGGEIFASAKRLYQMGLEAGKRENDNA